MKEWIGLLTVTIQLLTAIILHQKSREKKEKGTKKRRVHRKRK